MWERILKIVWDVCENEVAGYKHGNEVKVVQSYPTLGDPNGLYSPWNFSGQNTGVGTSNSSLDPFFRNRAEFCGKD